MIEHSIEMYLHVSSQLQDELQEMAFASALNHAADFSEQDENDLFAND